MGLLAGLVTGIGGGCTGGASSTEVPAICPRDEAPPAGAAGRCQITGDGSLDWTQSIAIFRGRDDEAPVVLLHHPDQIATTWSALPPPDDDPRRTRAQVALGGQRHLRMTGYASLEGPAFQLRRRVDVAAGHLWHRAGAPVRIVGEDEGGVVIEAHWLAEARTSGRTHAPCDAIAYERRAIPRDPRDAPPIDGPRLYPTVDALSLAATPGGCGIAVLHTRFGVDLHEVERRDEHVRIAGGDALAYDAWVRARDVQREPVDFDRDFASPMDDHDRCMRTATLGRDAPLRSGATPIGPAIGDLEAGAALQLPRGVDRPEADEAGVAWVVVEFQSLAIVAPPGAFLWAPRAALSLDPEPTNGCPDDPGG